jgi:hypothetical protein
LGEHFDKQEWRTFLKLEEEDDDDAMKEDVEDKEGQRVMIICKTGIYENGRERKRETSECYLPCFVLVLSIVVRCCFWNAGLDCGTMQHHHKGRSTSGVGVDVNVICDSSYAFLLWHLSSLTKNKVESCSAKTGGTVLRHKVFRIRYDLLKLHMYKFILYTFHIKTLKFVHRRS